MKTFFKTFIFLAVFIINPIKATVIYVYHGPGAGKVSVSQIIQALKKHTHGHYSIKTITPEMLLTSPWEKEAILIVMPGGADIPYHQHLKGLGNQRIRRFVEEGGSYLGICAGAYYGCRQVIFDEKGPLEVIGPRELDFFPHNARGPALCAYDYKSYAGARAAAVRLTPTPINATHHTATANILSVLFNGGCFFESAERYQKSHNITILARYDGLPTKPAAIIQRPLKKGMVILSGVHFEYDPTTLDPQDPYVKTFLEPLIKDNHQRQALCEKIFTLLLKYKENP